jgi:3-hydroxyisobutyrate dehydrogenase-like beta-hydroxyacid dehydrogenase
MANTLNQSHNLPITQVGLIGLGRMGSAMGQRILDGGFKLTVYDINPSSGNILIGHGARGAISPAEVAKNSQVILVSVPNTEAVDQVLWGLEGVASAAQPGSVVVDMSTISPLATREFAAKLAEKGIAMLDAPVSGGSEGARNGTLSAMVGGEESILEYVRPVLSILTNKITHVGEHGVGQAVKIVNQVILVGNIMAMSEGLLLAKSYGLDLERTLQAVQSGAAGSWMLTNLAPKVIQRDWTPSFTIELQLKDLRIALETADACGAPLLGTAQIFQLYRSLAARGHAQEGNHALIQALEILVEENNAGN